MNLTLNNRRALVCGSTQGIGWTIARDIANAGGCVTLIARNKEKLKARVNELNNQMEQKHHYLVADFSDPNTLKKVVQEEIGLNGGYDILINNTGGPPAGPVLNAITDEFNTAFASHLLCNHVLVQCCVASMKEKNFGRIINIISTSVKQPLKGLGVSNTIRAAVANWSKTLSFELAQYGITVNNVLPGATATQRLDEIIKNKTIKSGTSERNVIDEMVKEIPAGRFARPEEISNAVLFLSSEYASYITGINLPVDGGRTLCL